MQSELSLESLRDNTLLLVLAIKERSKEYETIGCSQRSYVLMVSMFLCYNTIKQPFSIINPLLFICNSDIKSFVAQTGKDGIQLSFPLLISSPAICHVTGTSSESIPQNLGLFRAGQVQFGS